MDGITTQQRKALHLFFSFVAKEMQDAGLDKRTVITHFPAIDMPVTGKDVKEIWRLAQIEHTGKESTNDLNTQDINEVWELMNRYVALMGIHVPFPSLESLYNKSRKDLAL